MGENMNASSEVGLLPYRLADGALIHNAVFETAVAPEGGCIEEAVKHQCCGCKLLQLGKVSLKCLEQLAPSAGAGLLALGSRAESCKQGKTEASGRANL